MSKSVRGQAKQTLRKCTSLDIMDNEHVGILHHSTGVYFIKKADSLDVVLIIIQVRSIDIDNLPKLTKILIKIYFIH